jgi:hypothetical protein
MNINKLLQLQNVNGHVIDGDTVKVFVTEKLPLSTIYSYIEDETTPWTEKDIVPDTVRVGLKTKKTDVIEIGVVKAQLDRNMYRPLQGGAEISPTRETFVGTIGLPVTYKTFNGRPMVGIYSNFIPWLERLGMPLGEEKGFITNAHVTQVDPTKPTNTEIVQPGASKYEIGETIFSLPIHKTKPNYYDVSIVRTDETITPTTITVGKTGGTPKNPKKGDKVHKYGRTTQYTTGTCVETGIVLLVDYGPVVGTATMVGASLFTKMSERGDSGAIVYHTDTNAPAALLFAGSQYYSIATPIEEVLKTTGVKPLL